MESAHLKKRKNLKTRKYRDKLRKNCNKIKLRDFAEKDGIKGTNSTSNTRVRNNNYITSNRLTLKVFPRVVKSATITRPLQRIQQSANFKKQLTELRHHNDAVVENVMLHDPSSEEFLFSPLSHDKGEFSCKKKELKDKYEEFMTEIQLYLEENNLNSNNEDVMFDNKKRLKELYYKNCQKEHEKDVSSPYSFRPSISKELVKGSPECHVNLAQDHCHFEPSSESCSSRVHTSYMLTESSYSSIESFTLYSINDIYDTPEYKYYPHKLK